MINITADIVNKHGVFDYNDEGYLEELREFAKSVHSKIPGAFFVPYEDSKHRLYLCLTGYPVTLGEIYIDRSNKSNQYLERIYCIASDKTLNQRGIPNVKESTNINTAARNAAKHLTMRPLHSVAELFTGKLRNLRDSRMGPVNRELSRARTAVFGYSAPDALVEELTTLYDEGYTFKHSSIKEKLDTFIARRQDYDAALADRPYGFDCVMAVVNTKNIVEKFYVVSIKARDANELNPNWESDSEQHALTVRPDALPPHIANAIPMLEMVEDGEYVEGFGAKAMHGLYFVEKRHG